jgi:alpha-beta hydrolase superfamily lysophospholipase
VSESVTRAFYLTSGAEATYTLFDDPPESTDDTLIPSAARTTASETATISAAIPAPRIPTVGVLLCPLFGNDDLCAYRARRTWAKTLAVAGHPTLRIDLPGTGNSSGGPYDLGRVDAWTDALATAAGWLRGAGGCSRVTAIGIGLGGLLSYRAAASGAPIDDLVLWSVPARGRAFVRELRVLSQMETSREREHETDGAENAQSLSKGAPTSSEQRGQPLPEGALTSGGFAMSAETVAALEALDLTKLALPGAAAHRVLMLERDGLDVDRRLHAALEESGVQVSTAPGPGYGAMIAPPQQSRPPAEVFAAVSAWLASGPTESAIAAPATAPTVSKALDLELDGTHVREVPLTIPHRDGQLVGVLAEPDGTAQFCAILLNAGALRHIGPNRMWVETARRWAAQGVSTLRIDLAGIGDADGDADALARNAGFYISDYIDQTNDVLAALVARDLPERFVLTGLCSGAYWAFHIALQDERVRGAFLVNPRVLFWDWSIAGVREARDMRKVLSMRTWRKLLRGQITGENIRTIAWAVGVVLASLPRRSLVSIRNRRAHRDELDRALERFDSTGAEILSVFTAEEPVLEELERGGGLQRMRAHRNVRVELIADLPAAHTLEPLPLQRAVNTLLDDALVRVLEDARNGGVSAAERELDLR